eukprot:COSAG05_NODE_959_length_6425_cov_4.388397_5_plen_59_part_00
MCSGQRKWWHCKAHLRRRLRQAALLLRQRQQVTLMLLLLPRILVRARVRQMRSQLMPR